MTVIAIDGPAASGKSTVARCLAQRFGCLHVNSGSLYRAVTWAVLNAGINPGDEAAVTALVHRLGIQLAPEGGSARLRIGTEDPEPYLRDPQVNAHVSRVSSYPEVRSLLTGILRGLGEQCALVMEGRDIGTVVFPATPYKLYIDASEEVRAARRAAQGETDSIAQRDAADSSRTNAPLTVASDAAVIDTSSMSLDEAVAAALAALEARGLTVA